MTEQILCPVCYWQWDGKREICPHCDFPIAEFRDLLAGKPVLWDEKLKQDFHDLLTKHRKVYEERQEGLKRKPDELVWKRAEVKEGLSEHPKTVWDSATATTKARHNASCNTIRDAVLKVWRLCKEAVAHELSSMDLADLVVFVSAIVIFSSAAIASAIQLMIGPMSEGILSASELLSGGISGALSMIMWRFLYRLLTVRFGDPINLVPRKNRNLARAVNIAVVGRFSAAAGVMSFYATFRALLNFGYREGLLAHPGVFYAITFLMLTCSNQGGELGL